MGKGIKVECAHDRLVPLNEFRANPIRSKGHPPYQIEALAAAIRKSGWRQPLIVSYESGFLVDGHARLMAARMLGLSQVPVDYQHFVSPRSEMLFRLTELFWHRGSRSSKKRRRKRVTKICPVCDLPFQVLPCHNSKVFCGRACRYIATRANSRHTFRCPGCGVSFVASIPKTLIGQNRYCSWECRNKGLHLHRQGADNPAWRGGVTPANQVARKAVEYREWRDAVFRRDNFTCQHCGARGRMHAHHIHPYARFAELRFDVANGLTLCVSCHGAVHNRVFRH